MIEKASIYTMNALNKPSELWHTSVSGKARPVLEGEHDKKLERPCVALRFECMHYNFSPIRYITLYQARIFMH